MKYNYYVAYCFTKHGSVGYGGMYFYNDNILEVSSEEDMEELKKFIKNSVRRERRENINDIVIMNFMRFKNDKDK